MHSYCYCFQRKDSIDPPRKLRNYGDVNDTKVVLKGDGSSSSKINFKVRSVERKSMRRSIPLPEPARSVNTLFYFCFNIYLLIFLPLRIAMRRNVSTMSKILKFSFYWKYWYWGTRIEKKKRCITSTTFFYDYSQVWPPKFSSICDYLSHIWLLLQKDSTHLRSQKYP